MNENIVLDLKGADGNAFVLLSEAKGGHSWIPAFVIVPGGIFNRPSSNRFNIFL